MSLTSLYIHIPFCKHRCGYCDFNTYAGLEELIPAYIQAICRELEVCSRSIQGPVTIHTIYFGGGTPSLIQPSQLAAILARIKDHFECTPCPEISMEANPGTVDAEYLQWVRQMGINRLSLGMQSGNPAELSLLERQHSVMDVARAVASARQAGFTNLNLDVIFGLPNQSLEAWLASLEAALAFQPEHLSLYALTLEHGTPLQHKVADGSLPEPEVDLAADMYEAARERLLQSGYIHYEISNWARMNGESKQYSCEHNLQYWRTLPYIGIGAGAHGYINHYRTVNVAAPSAYVMKMAHWEELTAIDGVPSTNATIEANFIDDETEMGEMMMMGLRLVEEGVSSQKFCDRFGVRLQDKFAPQIERLKGYGLLEWSDGQDEKLRLTRKGQLLGNQVFKEFI